MSDQSPLKRRYRRWLALYPQSFRAEYEEAMVAVLMPGADPDQSHPKSGEAADLVTHGLRRRTGRRFPGEWERAHAKVMFPTRIAIALWLCFISAMLVDFQHGELWLILLVPAIAAHTYIAYLSHTKRPAKADLFGMEPAGIEPATSCLQRALAAARKVLR